MTRLRVDDVLELLPDLEELRPLSDRIVSLSRADESRRWAASGELGTVGQRFVPLQGVKAEVGGLVSRIRDRIEAVYDGILGTLDALEAGEPARAVDSLLSLSAGEFEGRRLEAAEAYAVAASKLALELKDREPGVRALLSGARSARALGHLDVAKERYREAVRLATEMDDPERASTAAIGSGNVLVDQGLFQEAGEWYERSIALLERSKHQGPQRWHAALNLSIVHRMLGDLAESERWLSAAEKAHRRWPEEAGPALLANARGQVLQARGQPDVAEEHFRIAVQAAGDPDARVAMRVNLGECLVARGRLLEAGEEGRRAEHEALLASVLPRLPEVYRLLGRVAGARGIDDGFVFFEKALEVIRSRGLPRFELAQTLEAYGDFELQRGRETDGAVHLRGAAEIYAELGSHALREAAAAKVPEAEGPPATGSENDKE